MRDIEYLGIKGSKHQNDNCKEGLHRIPSLIIPEIVKGNVSESCINNIMIDNPQKIFKL